MNARPASSASPSEPPAGAGGAPTALIIAGMHRSGTSLVARVCNLLGVDLGRDLIDAADDNERGFWEHRGIVEAHERLLEAFGLAWDATEPLPEDWLRRPETARCRDRLRAIVEAEFAGKPLWGFKDPRAARLAPLWLDLAEEAGARARFAIPFRHPRAVAESLRQRNGFSIAKGELLWLTHLLEADAATRGFPVCFIDYEAFLEDWRGAAGRLARDLGLAWPVPVEAGAAEIGAFVDPALRHHAGAADGNGSANPWIERAFRAASAPDAAARARELDAARADFLDAQRTFFPWRDENARERIIEALQGENRALAGHVEDLEGARAALEAGLADARGHVADLEAGAAEARRHAAFLETELAALDAMAGAMAGAGAAVLATRRWRMGHAAGNLLALARLSPTGSAPADELLAGGRALERWRRARAGAKPPAGGGPE